MTSELMVLAISPQTHWYPLAFGKLQVSANAGDQRVEPQQPSPTPTRLKFKAQLVEFWSGKPGAQQPSGEAYVKALKLLRAIEKLDRPAILVDDGGVLALDLRISPEKQVFIEL